MCILSWSKNEIIPGIQSVVTNCVLKSTYILVCRYASCVGRILCLNYVAIEKALLWTQVASPLSGARLFGPALSANLFKVGPARDSHIPGPDQVLDLAIEK